MLNLKNQIGFTIIELMIFLAIAGGLFIFGISTLLKVQNNDQFRVDLGLLKTQIQAYINNTAEGNYTLPNNYQCLPGASRLYILNSATTSSMSPDCMYIGSALGFTNNTANNLWTIHDLPVFGYTFKNNSISQFQPNSTSLADALPITSAGLDQTYNIPGELSLYSVSYISSSGNQLMNGFLLYNKFNQYLSQSSSVLQSSSQYINLAPIEPYVPSNFLITNLANDVNELSDNCNTTTLNVCMINPTTDSPVLSSLATINPISGIDICLNDVNLGISASLVIGSRFNSSYKALATIMYNKRNCL